MSSIALVDVNNFYVSSEQVFDPKLRDKAVVVLSNNLCIHALLLKNVTNNL
jgi:DNA polymerase V